LKILEINLKKDFVKVVPEIADDFWHLYNIIRRYDTVYASTTREIKPEGKYARPRRGERIPVMLGVKVEEVSWDRLLGRLRIHGVIADAPDIVPTGAHHTLNITLNTPLTIVKENWPRHYIERLQRARRTSERPIIILNVDDEGYVIAMTAQYGIEVKVEERMRLPSKGETEKRDSAVDEYFRKIVKSLREVWTSTHRPITIIGVGFVKDDFAKWLRNEASDVAGSVVDVKSVNNSGTVGINEALRSGVLLSTFKQLRIAEETEVVEEILKRLGQDRTDVAYGFEKVEESAKVGAVQTLVLADSMLRECTDETRLFVEGLMRSVEEKGGRITVTSTEHEAGAKLEALGGIAALLRFPIH